MAEFARQLEQTFICLSAAVAEEALAGTDEPDQGASQAALGFVVVIVLCVDDLARLLDQRLGDGRVGMTQRRNGDAPAQIQVAFAGDVI